ncbi:hypothetical protein ASPFODRAFT_298614 [Aspergillus luchuensis CBS 106.47]|uniref:Uncharacterized protein n=1 Tax=Aspergillus luchuensis (strain CBS 106.47) TaxID=1137211 RepID=A0A1M3TBA2_ASPLC|nr:hypothetical protein ASPFODRAFT_298614 [Aspergillus luchuensis CBS 106.47]
MACYGTCYLLVYTQKRRLRIDGWMDDLINCGFFFFFLFISLDIFWPRHTRCSRDYSHLYLINWHLSLSLVLVVHLPLGFLSSGSSPSNSVWHRREQRNHIMLQLLFISYIHVSSFVQLIIWGGLCRFHISFSCIVIVLTIRLIGIYT